MYPRIKCNCGNDLGSIYYLYREMCSVKIKNSEIVLKTPIMQYDIEKDTIIEKIMDDIGLNLPCCRAIMMSQVMFKDLNV